MPDDSDFHPLTALFPPLEADEFGVLVADIRAHGLREPIWRHRDGRILDGRNRWLACKAAGIACPSRTFEGSEEEVLALIVSQNLHRRHLNASQRAMIAAQLATLGHGGDRRSKAPNDALTQDAAAQLLNVSPKSVERAKSVWRDGVLELQHAVEKGTLPVSRAAEIAKVEPEGQRRIVAGDVSFKRPAPERRHAEPGLYERRTVAVTVIQHPRTQPDLSRLVKVTTAELYALMDFLRRPIPQSPQKAAAMVPADRCSELAELAQQRQAWLAEFVRLLTACEGSTQH